MAKPSPLQPLQLLQGVEPNTVSHAAVLSACEKLGYTDLLPVLTKSGCPASVLVRATHEEA